MSKPLNKFTEQQEDEICDLYMSGQTLEQIAKKIKSYSYSIKKVLHKKKVIEYPICEECSLMIVYCRGLCQPCYFRNKHKEETKVKKLIKKDNLLSTKDDSIIRFYNAGMSIHKIAETMKISGYTVKNELNKAGKLLTGKCKTEGCDNAIISKGLCRICYNRIYRDAKKGMETPEEKRMKLNTLKSELKSKSTLYNCFTMSVPLERSVILHTDIMVIRDEIKQLEKELAE